MPNPEEILADVSAFADDDEDVVLDNAGNLLFVRGGEDIQCRIIVENDESTFVEVNGGRMPYRRFLTHFLGRLDVFAERLLSRRGTNVDTFVDGQARLRSVESDDAEGPASQLLLHECAHPLAFSAKVVFVTADAGQGKTVLLREMQQRSARSFMRGETSYLIWHVDLQGRQLLRLSEALMGDLGDLRLAGLWMPGIIRLMRHRALVLAIDGFDELAAEQGSTDAIGALALLVEQLDGRGMVIAASRRTFFDTEDYVRRSGFLHDSAGACQFDQLALQPWRPEETRYYLSNVVVDGERFDDPDSVYHELLAELADDASHPLLTRPFLVTLIARALLRYEQTPTEFLRGLEDPWRGVAAVVLAFVQREVAEKWRFRETGEPYLTVEQHMRLLGDVAEEMYRGQKDRLSLDVIETIVTLLLDEWGIDPGRRQQVLDMIRVHVLLVAPADDSLRTRSFDHPEFRDYFIAYALRQRLEHTEATGDASSLAQFLGIAQLSDATARYVCGMLALDDPQRRSLALVLTDITNREWRPTFVQVNCGTLLPNVLDRCNFSEATTFDARAVFSSVVFDRTTLENVIIRNGTFVNVALTNVTWRNFRLESCNLGELTIGSECRFENVSLVDCNLDGLRITTADEEIDREYAPERIVSKLRALGITTGVQLALDTQPTEEDSELHRLAYRFLRMFYRTTSVTGHTIDLRFRQDSGSVMDNLVPLLKRFEIIEEKEWRGSGQQQVWQIRDRIDDVLAADRVDAQGRLGNFWREINAR